MHKCFSALCGALVISGAMLINSQPVSAQSGLGVPAISSRFKEFLLHDVQFRPQNQRDHRMFSRGNGTAIGATATIGGTGGAQELLLAV